MNNRMGVDQLFFYKKWNSNASPFSSPISVDLMLSKLRFLFFLAYVSLPFTEIRDRIG